MSVRRGLAPYTICDVQLCTLRRDTHLCGTRFSAVPGDLLLGAEGLRHADGPGNERGVTVSRNWYYPPAAPTDPGLFQGPARVLPPAHPVPNVMGAFLPSYGLPLWARGLALLLVGGMLWQSGPVQLLQRHAASHAHTCHHCTDGMCPRTPSEACTCTASAPAGASGALFVESCDHPGPTAPAPLLTTKWAGVVPARVPHPREHTKQPVHRPCRLVPQRLGDEIFRPPRMGVLRA